MKKNFFLLFILVFSFELKAQRDYTVDNIAEYISNQKTFAVIPFTFKITAEKPRKMAQSDFDAAVYDAEKNGATAAQLALINRVLRKKKRVPVNPQPQARTNTLLKRNGEIKYTDGVWGSFDAYLPEELCEMLGVDAVIIGTVSSGKIFTTAGSVVMKFLKLGGSPSVSADLSLFDKDGTMIWQWSSDSMKASGMGSSVDDMMEYIFKKGARKLPYTGMELK